MLGLVGNKYTVNTVNPIKLVHTENEILVKMHKINLISFILFTLIYHTHQFLYSINVSFINISYIKQVSNVKGSN